MKHFGFALILFSLFPGNVFANVVINEVAWMGVPIQGVDARQWWRYEWVELHNMSDTLISVNGWRLSLEKEQVDFEIAFSGTIGPGDYFVVGASEKILNIDRNYSNLSGKFANAGQKIVLQNATGVVIEELDAREEWFAGDNETKTTMERRFPERPVSSVDNWGSSQKAGGSPGEINTILRKEKFVALQENGAASIAFATKKDPAWVSLFSLVGNKIFIPAVLMALGSSLLLLLLWQHLSGSQLPNASSSDALQD